MPGSTTFAELGSQTFAEATWTWANGPGGGGLPGSAELTIAATGFADLELAPTGFAVLTISA